jgi:hypothetical protein
MSITTETLTHTIKTRSTFAPVRVYPGGTVWGTTYEVDRVTVEIDYWTSEDDYPSGWHVSVEVLGWPLTKSGTRNKTVRRPERVVAQNYPDIVHDAVRAAYEAARTEGNIPFSVILGDDGYLGTTLTLL